MSFDDLQWLEPVGKRIREVEAETKRAKMKELPDDQHLRILWQVAVTSAIEGQGEAYAIFAKLLYWELTDTGPQIYLDVPITKEQYNATKIQSDS